MSNGGPVGHPRHFAPQHPLNWSVGRHEQLRAAEALGVTIPESILLRAVEVIR